MGVALIEILALIEFKFRDLETNNYVIGTDYIFVFDLRLYCLREIHIVKILFC